MRVFHFTPLPPIPNGIADYGSKLAAAMSHEIGCVAVADRDGLSAPAGIPLMREAAALDAMRDGDVALYQIGNNPDHGAILRHALMRPGIVLLHDLRLLYLFQVAPPGDATMLASLRRANPALFAARVRAIVEDRHFARSDYFFFDMIAGLLERSLAVVVHSEFARRSICLRYGDGVADKIHVIPHFAEAPPSAAAETGGRGLLARLGMRRAGRRAPGARAAILRAMGLPAETHVLVTAGFATEAKRFDTLAPALDALIRDGVEVAWIHAGSVRRDEYDLPELIARLPALAGRVHVTGYLEEGALDALINDADVFVNLRFPSVGESSGTLARALAAGRCCVVTRTAAYAELPDAVCPKIPPVGAQGALATLLRTLLADPQRREEHGAAAARFASRQLGLAGIASRFAALARSVAGQARAVDLPLWPGEEASALGTRTLGPAEPEELLRLLADLEADPEAFVTAIDIDRMSEAGRHVAEVRGAFPAPSVSGRPVG